MTQVASGTGNGLFTATASGLTPLTTYYVRTYATNSLGTSYGSVVSFTTTALPLTIVSTSPTNPARAAAVAGLVSVTFDQVVTSGSATALQVFSAQRGGRRTTGGSGTTTLSGSTTSFVPTYAFRPGETVQATVKTTATAMAGGTLARARVLSFTTATSGTGQGSMVALAINPEPAVGVGPQSVAVGDVDGDGTLDFVTANVDANTVSVRYNNSVGNFTARFADIGVGASPCSVALGDVNGDSRLDLLTANAGSTAANVRLNTGNGTFVNGTDRGFAAQPYGLCLADADGDLDLLALDRTNDVLRVRFNEAELATTALAPTRNRRNAAAGSHVALSFSLPLQNTAATQGACGCTVHSAAGG